MLGGRRQRIGLIDLDTVGSFSSRVPSAPCPNLENLLMMNEMQLPSDTKEAASRMRQLVACPSCGSNDLRDLFDDNDISDNDTLPDPLRRSDYRLCRHCVLIFASWRQVPEAADAYYDLFPSLEHRDYASYPPPQTYRDNKAKVANWIAGELEKEELLKDHVRILHVRCDCGSLGPAIRSHVPNAVVVGLDYFESNVRFANENGNVEASDLSPAGATPLHQEKFDIIVINHMFTHALDLHSDLGIYLEMLGEKGALFVYNEIDFSEMLRLGGRYFRLKPVNNYHKQLFSPHSFQRFFASAGCRIVCAQRRRNSLYALVKRDPTVHFEPASETEAKTVGEQVEAWMGYRRSLKGRILSWPPIRKSLKALASPAPQLPY
ncbi:MAG: methyltransferase domain-containing protein [Geminicoccaceae bacterium]